MTDPISHESPDSDPKSLSEDEVRFAPKPEHAHGHEADHAAKKRLKTSLKVVSEHAEEEDAAKDEETAKKKRGDALFWNLCLGLVGLIVIGVGYIVYEKFSQLPDPVKDAQEELAQNNTLLLEKQEHLKEVLNKTAPKEQLLNLLDIFEKTATDLEDTQKSIEKEKLRVAGIRGEIRSYYDRYRQATRAKARGRKFDMLQTAHSQKTYLNVEITRVENDFVRITHEQGSTSIPASDLPDNLRELLAYGDPLNINAMNQTDANLQAPVVRQVQAPAPAATAPRATPRPTPKKVRATDLDPPSGRPQIDTPTNNGTSTDSSPGAGWIPPTHSPLPPI